MKKIKLITTLTVIPTLATCLLPIASCSQEEPTVIKDITVTNSSDRIYINFEDLPETWKTNTDFDVSFSFNEEYKTLDLDESKVLVNQTDIKNKDEVILNDFRLFIPGKYITDNLTISLQVKDITYKVVNECDKNIVFENLPSDITLGFGINTQYSINNDQLIDTAKSDIKVKGISIKNELGVIWDNNYLQIPGKYVTGIIEIQLVLRDKKSYTIDTSGCSGITLSTITSPVLEQTKIKITYTIDKTTDVVDKELSDILVDGVSIAKKTGVKYLDKEIYIPKELVTGNVTIKIVTEGAKLIDQDWSTIIEACDQYETDQDLTTFLSKFTIDGNVVTSLDQLIGAKHTMRLAFYNATTEQWSYKNVLVRVVGTNHDAVTDKTYKAALTFQLVNLLSDLDGNQMRCMYDNAEVNKYEDSTLYWNLNNTNYGYATWYDKDNHELTQYKDSIDYMLANGDDTLYKGIKKVDKYVNHDNGSYPTHDWQEIKMTNVKFFPLLFKEMNLTVEEGDPAVETVNPTAYQYWINHNTDKEKIMKDENNNAWYYWLASPDTNNNFFAWNVSDSGTKNRADVKTERFGVQFAFAI